MQQFIVASVNEIKRELGRDKNSVDDTQGDG